MNFQGLQAKYRRIFQENAAWKLLRADNTPIILAFISDLFAEESEVPFGRARIALAAVVKKHPMAAGLEELVTYLRVAKSVGATTLVGKESVRMKDTQGAQLQASIPKYLLSAEMFPANIKDLVI